MAGKLKFGNIGELITKYSDLVLAGFVVVVLGLVIIPLPAIILDILISVDLALGIVITLVALYVSDALKIASFPTILLITTLYRLSLNIAATRLILSYGEAGRVIHTFGEVVAGRNYVVGGILFIII